MLENRMLRRIFGSKREEVAGGWRRLRNEFHQFSSSSSSFLGSTVQLSPWPPPQNPAEFLGGFSTIFFFTG
jgi:hypothetical protein